MTGSIRKAVCKIQSYPFNVNLARHVSVQSPPYWHDPVSGRKNAHQFVRIAAPSDDTKQLGYWIRLDKG